MSTIKTLEQALEALGRFKKVENIDGKPNQFKLFFEEGRLFQSYDKIISIIINGQVYLTTDYDYSQTTSKYRCKFLNELKKETDKKIKEGTYIMLEK